MSTRTYSCSTRGQCEPNERYGVFPSEAECQRECQGIPNRDLFLQVYSFAPEDALGLAPSDQLQVLRNIFRENVSTPFPSQALEALIEEDYVYLYQNFGRLEWLTQRLDELDFLLLELLSEATNLPVNLSAFRRRFVAVLQDVFQDSEGTFRTLIFEGNRPSNYEELLNLAYLVIDARLAINRFPVHQQDPRVKEFLDRHWEDLVNLFGNFIWLEEIEQIWAGERGWDGPPLGALEDQGD